jgi:hypothetical protein
MKKAKRVQRPRLELTESSDITGQILNLHDDFVLLDHRQAGELCLDKRDTERLHKFLGRALAYLEQRKASGK